MANIKRIDHVAIAVDATSSDRFSDIPEANGALHLIDRFLDEVIQHYQPDINNVFLLGFSQGTILSTAYALNHPEKVQHVVALSGYVNEQLIQKPLEKQRFKNLDFFIYPGPDRHDYTCTLYISHANLCCISKTTVV